METLSVNLPVLLKAVKCPECGGNLEAPDKGQDITRCRFCHANILIVRPGASIYAWRKLAEAAALAGNHAEAYLYYTKILEFNADNPEAWFGKGVAAGWLSPLGHNRFAELCAGVQRAIELAPSKELRQRGAATIYEVSRSFYDVLVRYSTGNLLLDRVWPEYVAQSSEVISTLRLANNLDPENKDVIALVVTICEELLESIEYEDIYSDFQVKTLELTPEQKITFRRILAAFTDK